MDDHLARAKQFIAIAESGDSKLAAYKKAADEIIKAREADQRLTWSVVNDQLGRGPDYARRLVSWRNNLAARGQLPFGGEAETERKAQSHAKSVLKDPERLEQVIPELPTRALQELADRADEEVAGRREAGRAEHDTRPTARDLMGNDPFKPDEFWADNVIVRVNRNARELASLIERGGGLLLGAMEVEVAYEYLEEAERLIAEARAAAQEQVRDGMKVA